MTTWPTAAFRLTRCPLLLVMAWLGAASPAAGNVTASDAAGQLRVMGDAEAVSRSIQARPCLSSWRGPSYATIDDLDGC